MSNLITVTEFATFRNISEKINVKKTNEEIGLAQKSDLYDILGDFFFDVLDNAEDVSYSDLMDGSTFEYCDESFTHDGIKALLADFTYARYIYMINVNLTAFGAQSKFTEDSNGIDRNTIKDIAKQAQLDANIKFKTIQKYLLSNPDNLFDRYCKTQNVDAGFFSQKFYKL